MKIEDWRTEIDELDRELLRLLNRRAHMATEVGLLKRTAGIAIADPQRERDVIARVCCANPGPLDSQAVGRLFRHIIRESKRVEEIAVGRVAELQSERVI
ncbi:MAG: chorismate mutase [Pyrinomonadaceae bacterium]